MKNSENQAPEGGPTDEHLMNFLAPWVIADDPKDRADFLAALRAALAAQPQADDGNEAMAECMRMFRSDMIAAGVITKAVPPMMMTEAILGALAARPQPAPEPAGSARCPRCWEPITPAPTTHDVRELRKWLNEEPSRPIDRQALARVLAAQPQE